MRRFQQNEQPRPSHVFPVGGPEGRGDLSVRVLRGAPGSLHEPAEGDGLFLRELREGHRLVFGDAFLAPLG